MESFLRLTERSYDLIRCVFSGFIVDFDMMSGHRTQELFEFISINCCINSTAFQNSNNFKYLETVKLLIDKPF